MDARTRSHMGPVVAAYDAHCDVCIKLLANELRSNLWQPTKAVKVHDPKGTGGTRTFSVLAIEDLLLYHALCIPIAEKLKDSNKALYGKKVFGHIPFMRKGQLLKDWQQSYIGFSASIRKAYKDGFRVRATFDLTACYDSIDHNVLRYFLLRLGATDSCCDFLYSLLRKWSQIDDDPAYQLGHGIPQGPTPSAIFSEVILSHFDQALSSQNGVRYFRYVDDIRIYAKTEDGLRRALLKLERISKQIGLFPQSSKIGIRAINTLDDELKSISDPPEEVLSKPELNQAKLQKRILELTKRGQIAQNHLTRVKYMIYRSRPNSRLAQHLCKLLSNYPQLHICIGAALAQAPPLADGAKKAWTKFLLEHRVYDTVAASVLHGLASNSEQDRAELLRRLVLDPDSCDCILACEVYRASLGTDHLPARKMEELVKTVGKWWEACRIISELPIDHYGDATYKRLLSSAIKSDSTDLALCGASYLGYLKGFLPDNKCLEGANPIAQGVFEELKLISKTRRKCYAARAIRRTFDWPFLEGCSLRKFCGSNYQLVCRKVGAWLFAYRDRDHTKAINILDTICDELTGCLFERDCRLGTAQRGNVGAVLNGSTCQFARRYPKWYQAVDYVHDLRKRSELSHARKKSRQGARSTATRTINYPEISKAHEHLKRGLVELKKKNLI